VKQIEYFYSGHSAFAYLGAKRLSEICAAQGWSIIHRPFDFWPVVRAAAGPDFKVRSAAHMSYFFGRELTRWAEWRDLPIVSFRPTFHDNPLALPNGVIIAAADAGGDVDGLSFDILQAHWRDDADIADTATLVELAKKRGMDGENLIAAAMSEGVQAIHAANTAEAIERNVFGSPTYFVDGDMFYGQDHLDMVERAMQTPFVPEAIH
jgi:2-hydroxychromene-2-carboxylate isomerase